MCNFQNIVQNYREFLEELNGLYMPRRLSKYDGPVEDGIQAKKFRELIHSFDIIS